MSLHGRPWVTFSTHSPVPSPPSLSDQFWAPQALSPKWTSLDLLCGSWLAVYIGCCSHLGFRPSLPSRPPSLSSGIYPLFSRIQVSSHEHTIIAIPACLFPHWTIPVSREEMLTVREKFRAVSWRQPNFLSKPVVSRYLLLIRKSE